MSDAGGGHARVAELLARFEALHPRVIDLSLGRIEALLEKLGRPQDRLPPVVHIAGTNGKGSTLAFLRALLEAAGRRVHLYSSPHLVRFNERIRLAGTVIDDAALVEVMSEADRANRGAQITFFEITTAAAFLAFARNPADFLLLETGLGGRFDATNVLAAPALTGITPVALDHQHFLGETLAEIAGEKAGIIKPGVPCVVAAQPDAASAVIERTANRLGAPLWQFGDAWNLDAGAAYSSPLRRLPLGDLPLAGDHQMANAAMALALLDQIAPDTDDTTAARGLAVAHWPGRLQNLAGHPIAALLPSGWELWLDGGHNPSAGEALAAWAAADSRPLHLVSGMLSTKDTAGFIKPLAAQAASFTAVPVPSSTASLAPAALAEIAERAGIAAGIAPDTQSALRSLAGKHAGPARVLICGSLYLAGTVLGMGDFDRNPEAGALPPARA